MSKEKIAIVVDSGCDVTAALSEGLDIYKLPLRVIIDSETYTDTEITPDEVYTALDSKKVTTSLPSGKDILDTLTILEKEGYTDVIAVTISSGLSGTNNVLNTLKNEVPGLNIEVIDTKNISLGSGLLAIEAAKMVKEGKTFNEIIKTINHKIKDSKVFFTVDSLEYLQRGGRIGLVAGTVASILNLKPIISCNDDGIYYTVTKVRGYRKSINKMIELAKDFIGNHTNFDIMVVNADSKVNLEEYVSKIKEEIKNVNDVIVTKISPSLGIHTGPEALGIAVLLK